MMVKELPTPLVSNRENQNVIKIMKKDSQAVRVKLIVGSLPEKVVMAFYAVNEEKNGEEATLKTCRDVLENTFGHGAEPLVEEIQHCIKGLESVEETRSALVSQLREALQDQEAKLDVIHKQLQIARRQIELPGQMKGWCELSPIHSTPTSNSNLVPEVMKMGESQFSGAQTPGASFQPKPSQPMTSFMPVQSTEEEKKKAAAAAMAAMAAKVAASTSSAQMLTSVLSSLVAEEAASMNGGRSSHPPDSGLNIPMYPPEKRAKLEKPHSDVNSSDRGSKNSYFASLQQSLPLPMSQTSQGETQFSQPPPNNHFVQSSAVMMPYGYNTPAQTPPLPPNVLMGLARPPTNQQQQSPASGGYYRLPGVGFYGLSHPPATPPMPRQ